MAEEHLDVPVSLTGSFNLLLNLVDAMHQIVNVKLAAGGGILAARVGVGLAVALNFVVLVASQVADFNTNDLCDEGLHVPYEVGLDKQYPGSVDDTD